MKHLGIKLRPKSFLHLGHRENWLEGSLPYIHSDTLFSALCHGYLLLFGQADQFIEAFKPDCPDRELPFLISSAFPFQGQDLFFPLPANQLLSVNSSLCEAKKLKKIKYVNQKLLFRLLKGEKLIDLLEEIEISAELKTQPPAGNQKKTSGSPASDIQKKLDGKDEIWRSEDVPRIALNPLNNHPGENYFHFGQVSYSKESGLFILVQLNDRSWENTLKSLFRLLADEGVGGDRTCGKGLFHQPEFFDFDLPDITGSKALYAISLYIPKPEELSGLKESFYELEERKGYVFSPLNRSLRRRSVRAIVEGSVLLNNIKRTGTMADVTPQTNSLSHRVYRYGYLFSFPCNLEET